MAGASLDLDTPTTKLVSYMVAIQACYVNTTYPTSSVDIRYPFFFLSILYLTLFRAMALVTDRLNVNKPATPERKQGKLTLAQLNDNKNLDVDT